MNEFLQQLINGLAVGGIYALVALGYTMVYGVLKLINFAHGDIFTIGAYLGMTLLVSGGLSGSMTPVLAVGLVVIIVFGLVALLGVALERVAYRPLRKANRLAAVVSALGASIVFQNAVMLIYGARVYVYPENLIPTLTFNIFGLNVPLMRVIVIVSSLVLMLALYAFINRTRMGKAMRAVSEDKAAAALMGISVNRTISITFAIGSALAAVASIFYGMSYIYIKPTTGAMPGIKAFTAAVFGGIGSVPGAMLGGILLGLIEQLSKTYISTLWADAIVFGVLVLVLVVKPTGLLGKTMNEKV